MRILRVPLYECTQEAFLLFCRMKILLLRGDVDVGFTDTFYGP